MMTIGAGNEAVGDSAEKVDKSGATKPGAPTIAFGNQEAVVVPNLAGQTVRSVMEACSRIGLVPALIGSGVALEQSVEGGNASDARHAVDGAVRQAQGGWCRRR